MRPNFVAQAARDGDIRKECMTVNNPEPMNETELAAVKAKEDLYFANHWHKIIMPFLRYKTPSVAATEQFNFKNISLDISDPLFFHVDMVKPGRNTFVI